MNKPRISSGTVEEACELNITSNSTDTGSKPEIINYDFNWTENQEMTMIGCYYYGYVATHIPGKYPREQIFSRTIVGQKCYRKEV